MNNKPKILVVEDEEPISILIKYNLEKAGFNVSQAFDGEEALEKIEESAPDLIIMDLMMPKMSGYELTAEIRNSEYIKDIPIIMLTARGQETDKLQGFNNGVDDYLTKPFSTKELEARVRAVLKRTSPAVLHNKLSYADITIDSGKKVAFISNKKIELSMKEFNLLSYLVENPEVVHSRDTLLRKIWRDESEVESRVVDTSVRRLRSALEQTIPGSEDLIKTLRGEGYFLSKNNDI